MPDSENAIGFFGYIGEMGEVKNLGLENISVIGNDNVGGLAGYNLGGIHYSYVTGNVMGENYPSESFRGLKNKEMNEFGEYRTQRLVLEAWDRLETGKLK